MISIEILENVIQNYSWGSYTAIGNLLGQEISSSNPQAELWMGAHPSASSMITMNGKRISLLELLTLYPEDILGKSTIKKFGKNLPFLFKVLAAQKPLSIQAHPNSKQAKEGFNTENKKKIPLYASNRQYKDRNHKPECICALTDFWLLKGFRSISAIVSFMEELSDGLLENEVSQLKKNPRAIGLKNFYQVLMTADSAKKDDLIHTVVVNAQKDVDADPSYRWILELYQEYGNDMGVLSPLLMNLICLKPGEAMFLSSGELHAYLQGVGIEAMANSDNVIRGGLTSKHVDISELLKIANFEEQSRDILVPEETGTGEKSYPCKAEEFVISIIQVNGHTDYRSLQKRNVEIMICVDGTAAIYDADNSKSIALNKGTSVLIPAAVNTYHINGDATLYKATVPLG